MKNRVAYKKSVLLFSGGKREKIFSLGERETCRIKVKARFRWLKNELVKIKFASPSLFCAKVLEISEHKKKGPRP